MISNNWNEASGRPHVVFLLGAGASFGSDTVGTPPLGDRLFDELRRFDSPGWGAVSAGTAAALRADFEQGLLQIDPYRLPRLQRSMAAYFFEFQPQPSSLYRRLARRIAQGSWSGAFCTLNYDRLLELSLVAENVARFVGKRRATSSEGSVELCFPHGCCHLFSGGTRAPAQSVSFHGLGVHVEGNRVAPIDDPVLFQKRICTDAMPPIMCYFELQKRTSSNQRFLDEQRRRWEDLALSAEVIVAIGVRLRRHDEHLWNPMSDSPARIVYCGGCAGAQEFTSWSEQNRPGRGDLVLKGYFQNEFNAICSEAHL